MELCGFAYDADVHCVECAVKRFGEGIRESSEGFEDSEGNEPSAIFEDSESDTPDHCADCHAFLGTALTLDGYAYVVEALIGATGRPDVLREWFDAYSAGFDADDFETLARAWLPYVFPAGLASITNVDHAALYTFERPTDRDDFTRGREFGDAWKRYDPWKSLPTVN
jgi:hypothetical protein